MEVFKWISDCVNEFYSMLFNTDYAFGGISWGVFFFGFTIISLLFMFLRSLFGVFENDYESQDVRRNYTNKLNQWSSVYAKYGVPQKAKAPKNYKRK